MSQQLSDRVMNMAESATLVMAQAARDLVEQGVDVINLSVGEPDFDTPKYICEAAKKAVDDGQYHHYTPVAGYIALKNAIATKLKRDNNIDASVNDIVVSTGAKQSIANVILSLVNPGDEVVILAPYWVSYSDIVQFAGGVPVIVSGKLDQGFKASADDIKDAITDKTKCVMFSSPSNPTGAMFTEEELKAIIKVVPKDVVFLSDEIYEYINYVGKHTSIGALEGAKDRTVTINGFSKGFAMTGWRVGYIHGPSYIVKAANKIQGQVTSGTNAIAQAACITALEDRDGFRQANIEMSEAFLRRRELIISLFQKIPNISISVPEGAFYVFPDVSAYFGKKTPDGEVINNATDLSLYFLNYANVSCVTGVAFGAPNNLRFSYATSDEKIVKALAKVSEWFAKLS